MFPRILRIDVSFLYSIGSEPETSSFEIPFLEAALVQMVGISFATITPGRVGEGSKAVLLHKRAGVPISSALGMVIFER